MTSLALTELLGAPVFDTGGSQCGRVRELAINPQEDRARIAMFIVRTKAGDRLLPFNAVGSMNGGIYATTLSSNWAPVNGAEGLYLLERDLLDQQIIDVHGRKVVRVNDVDLTEDIHADRPILRVGSVDVGVRGAIRRLLKGVVPMTALRSLLHQIPPRLISWEFVDLIETDPARRVKLKISHERLARLHPADIADIVEDLAPAEREAVFQTLDQEVAAGALEEVEPKVQKSIVESLNSERAAEIVEEMNPNAAADLLADLTEERSSQILREMAPAERQEMTELLEFRENSAAGRMNTLFVALPVHATTGDGIEALRNFVGGADTVSTIYLVDSKGTLAGAVPLARLVLAPPNAALLSLTQEPLIFALGSTNESQVAELFDKYNLWTLPVVDENRKLTGVITSDDVIAVLRTKL